MAEQEIEVVVSQPRVVPTEMTGTEYLEWMFDNDTGARLPMTIEVDVDIYLPRSERG